MSLDPALRSRIEALLHSHRVVLFMKGEPAAPQCGFSAKAVGALDAAGAEFVHVDVLSDPEIREGIKQYGQWPTIPQLYVDGELVGGSDIIGQMESSGELHRVLGVAPPDRTPPRVEVTPSAVAMLREAVANAGDGYAVQVAVDRAFETRLQLAPVDAAAIAVEVDGLRLQFDQPSARRAGGLRVDWVDDERGRGLLVDNPNAAPKVQRISPSQAAERAARGTLRIVDVRPAAERALAEINIAHDSFDDAGMAHLEALAKDTALAFLCHHGGRSGQAAEHFRSRGFTEVYNIEGGIDRWSLETDTHVPRY